jgi:flagellar hook-associated protein 1
MSNLLTSLVSSANALRVFERALMVSQNNVTNASTPGYAAQRMNLEAADFDVNLGLIGGVRAGDVVSSRDLYAEQAVRRQLESLGYHEQTAQTLSAIGNTFDVSGGKGIPGALSSLFDSFSAWSLQPNNASARQTVIDRATALADSFHQMSAGLAQASSIADQRMGQTVDTINALGAKLQELNSERRRGGQNDPGLDTQVQTTIEQLSELVNVTSLYQEDGSVTVLVGGQTPLVIGENLFRLGVRFDLPASATPDYPAAQGPARIVDSDGRDITNQVTLGQLGGLLNVRNNVLPALNGDAYHAGSINALAKAVADRINGLLTAGQISDGPPATAGKPLFAYDISSDASVARTLTLDLGITAADLAAIRPGPPYIANGTALQLAELANPQSDTDRIDGLSYVEYYGQAAALVGSRLADARVNQDFKTQMVAQARSLREELSGVSLDEEAILLIQYQRAYQANAKMVNILTELTQTALELIR